MNFTLRNIAIVSLIVGLAMIGIAKWLEHRRKYQLMPSLVAPTPLLIFGGTIALISVVVIILPARS